MNRSYHNIESRRLPGHFYRIGYTKSGGIVRIYGDAKHGWTVDGKYFGKLSYVSTHLETI